MSLIGGSIPVGATFAPTGGSATTLSSLGFDRSGGKLLLTDGAIPSLRSVITVSHVEASANSAYPGGYTPLKRRLARTKPITLADGSIFVNQVIIEMIMHQETTDAQVDELRSVGICVLTDTDFEAFWEDAILA